jgi:heptosyltransferase-2
MKGAIMNYVNDSAPLHFASAVNAPVTAVFCSTVPAFGFGPLSDVSFVVETDIPLSCRPCGLHGYKACPLGHFNCSIIEKEKLLARITE